MAREFLGEVVVKWLTEDGEDRRMQLVQPFGFRDAAGKEWGVPAGTKVDGASIPRLLWTFGPPFVGDYRRASVVHDHFCDTKAESWRATHRMFFEGCLAGGIDELIAKAMFAAVYSGGPRWPDPGATILVMIGDERLKRLGEKMGPGELKVIHAVDPDAFEKVSNWVLSENPELGEIEAEIDKRTAYSVRPAGELE